MERILNYTVTEEFYNQSIKTVLKQYFKMSSNLIKALKNTEMGITVNGLHQKVTYCLKPGDLLKLTIKESRSEGIEPAPIKLKIVYEDDDIIIIDKPGGISTHPSSGNYSNTVANGLMYYFDTKGEERTFRAVNRLDKDTSGLMCIAKNSYSHARLCDTLHESFIRRYTAVAEGCISRDGEITAPIARCDDSVIKRCIRSDGQYAKTNYRVLSVRSEDTIVELELETGRTHQIRVHMSHIGHPLLGDWLYGSERTNMRTALHSSYIRLTHPVTGKTLEFHSPVADDVFEFFKKT